MKSLRTASVECLCNFDALVALCLRFAPWTFSRSSAKGRTQAKLKGRSASIYAFVQSWVRYVVRLAILCCFGGCGPDQLVRSSRTLLTAPRKPAPWSAKGEWLYSLLSYKSLLQLAAMECNNDSMSYCGWKSGSLDIAIRISRAPPQPAITHDVGDKGRGQNRAADRQPRKSGSMERGLRFAHTRTISQFSLA